MQSGRQRLTPLPFAFVEKRMVLTICLTFMGTTGIYAVVLWLACHRVSCHLQGNAEAANAVVQHVLLPLLGRQAAPDAVDPDQAAEES